MEVFLGVEGFYGGEITPYGQLMMKNARLLNSRSGGTIHALKQILSNKNFVLTLGIVF